ncbi:MAG TPA: TlpA disulfide reductase family protein [Bryobacteraceae bacterium]|nr:TlpA disulfide reductase family protein [Bryobacteraceae bacterium]
MIINPVKIDRLLRVSIGVLLCALIYVIFSSIHERIVGVGDSAPGFSITADNGRTVSRNDFGGKLLVLNFWATWCQPCVEEIPSLDQFQRELASSGVVVLGVSVDKDPKAYQRFLNRAHVSFMTARDPDNKINAEYGTFKFPETYIINRDGKVLVKVISATNWTDDKMVSYVKSLL